MGNLYCIILSASFLLTSASTLFGQSDVIHHYQKHWQSRVLDSYKTDIVDVAIYGESICRYGADFYVNGRDEPVVTVNKTVEYAKIKQYDTTGWVALLRIWDGDDIVGNKFQFVHQDASGVIEQHSFDLGDDFPFSTIDFADFSVINNVLFVVLDEYSQSLYYFNTSTDEIHYESLDFEYSGFGAIEYLENNYYLITNDFGFFIFDDNLTLVNSLAMDLNEGLMAVKENDSLIHVLTENKRYIVTINNLEVMYEESVVENYEYSSIAVVPNLGVYVLSESDDLRVLELIYNDDSRVFLTMPDIKHCEFNSVSASIDGYNLFGYYLKSIWYLHLAWGDGEYGFARSAIEYKSTDVGKDNFTQVAIEVDSALISLDTTSYFVQANGNVHVNTSTQLHFKLKIKNLGADTIKNVSVFSNGGQTFNCGFYYFYDVIEGIELAPSQSIVRDGIFRIITPEFTDLCIYTNGANGILDSDTLDNEICLDLSTVTYQMPFVEDTKEWTVSSTGSAHNLTISERYRFSDSDHLIEDRIYKELLVSNQAFAADFSGTGVYYRNMGQQVYAYEMEQEQEVLVYDFGLEVGEMFTSEYIDGSADGTSLIVTEVDSVELEDGAKHKRLQLACYDNGEIVDAFGYTWIEGVGDLRGVQVRNGTCNHDTIVSELSCYKLNEDLVYQSGGECWVIVSTKDLAYKELKIYPNPASDRLQILTQEKVNKVTIYNTQGQLVLQGSDKVINIETLPQGVYMLKVENVENVKSIQQFVKL